MASLHFLSASRYSMIPSCWLEHRQGQGQGGRLLLSHHQMNNICRRPRKPSCPAAAPVPVPVTNGPPPTTGLLITAAAAAVVISVVMGANAVEIRRTTAAAAEETLSNIPQMLSGDQECLPEQQQQQQQQQEDCKNKKKKARIQKPKSRKAESCTIKCVTTCIRGGDGSPGEGPLNVRRPLVIFKQGFRSRQYCLMECSDICNLIRDGDDGP